MFLLSNRIIKAKNVFVQIQKQFKSNQTTKAKIVDITNDSKLGQVKYVKLKSNDPLLTTLMIDARTKRNKIETKNQQIVIEGKRLLSEAFNCGLDLKTLVFSHDEDISEFNDVIAKFENAKIYKTLRHELKQWSTLKTSSGLLALFKHPKYTDSVRKKIENQSTLPLTVICDNIKEPNNLGSIIRTCAAVACKKVIVLKGCCDPWETKALRGGCGAQFRIDISTNTTWNDVPEYLTTSSTIFVAENNLEKLRKILIPVQEYSNINVSSDNVVIIGGETHGISDEAYSLIRSRMGNAIHIPLGNGVESLNTASALALILFSMRLKLEK